MKGSPGYVDQSVRTSPLLFPPRGPSHGYRQFTITQQWKWAIWPFELFSVTLIFFKKFIFSIIFMNLFHKKDRIIKIQSLWHLLSVCISDFLSLSDFLSFSLHHHIHLPGFVFTYCILYIYQWWFCCILIHTCEKNLSKAILNSYHTCAFFRLVWYSSCSQ